MVASSSCLCEPTLCVQSCMLLDSEFLQKWRRLRSVTMLNPLEVHRQSQDTQEPSDQRTKEATKQ